MNITRKEKQKLLCENMVKALVGEKHDALWWSSPNRAFKNQTPFVAFELNPDEVYDYLAWHCYGAMG